MSEHQDILRLLAEADQRHAERRKRKKATATEAYARIGGFPPIKAQRPTYWWEREQKEVIVTETTNEEDLSELLEW
jgi:Leu/Phe-tRNA-protein transferase